MVAETVASAAEVEASAALLELTPEAGENSFGRKPPAAPSAKAKTASTPTRTATAFFGSKARSLPTAAMALSTRPTWS